LVGHPNVVRLHENIVTLGYGDCTKIYIILEFITVVNCLKIVIHHGQLSEAESKRYFQQLIDGVNYCHIKGVYHRDLKPENLLLDSQGNLKFQIRACHKGYDGAVADVWSCGVILYVLMVGYLPFDEIDRTTLSSKSCSFIFLNSCPHWSSFISFSILKLNKELLLVGVMFLSNLLNSEDVNLDDVNAVFDDPEEELVDEPCSNEDVRPLAFNHQTRFVSQKPAKVVLLSMEVVAQLIGFKTHIHNYKIRVEGLSANKTYVFQVAPTFFMVDIQKASGDAGEYLKMDVGPSERRSVTASNRRLDELERRGRGHGRGRARVHDDDMHIGMDDDPIHGAPTM
ncbi:CBL-interacting serine/threonine-protein kinase 8, partial [Camellia lanceoleosa]